MLHDFDFGNGLKWAVALVFNGDEVGGSVPVAGGDVMVVEATLAAGMEELTRWFGTGCIGIESTAWFLVRRDLDGRLWLTLGLVVGGSNAGVLASKGVV